MDNLEVRRKRYLRAAALSAASLEPVVPLSTSVNNLFVTVFAGEDLVLERKARLATISKANDQFLPLSKVPI
jgi:hypothetical protein